jgi:hypothetical protein
MKRCSIIIILLFLSMVILSLVVGCGEPPQVNPDPVITESTAPILGPENLVTRSQNLIDETITVGAGDHHDIPFSVDLDTMHNVRVTGSFMASGGARNDITAIIMDEVDYINWSNLHHVDVLYTSGQLTTAIIDAPITTSGKYHLVFTNNFSVFSSKEVSAKVDLTWSEVSNH